MSPLILGQAAAEYGAMSTIAAALESALFKLEAWVSHGHNAYVVGGVLILLAVLLFRRRR